ncbi:hypothetical protein JAO76_02150 [Pontibacter sp. BT310]|uniref:YD repeat-containing protein n=1 Tax=Pontibacter populi TaxID=890055 RepID=A0ABS6X7F6_9BACT|nr:MULTISPECIES: hypothetical protein [Pontibacter]MBJ6116974.1 hypothetical protein [Pontibacter sp. BT310]MBR0569398.1 hypothetical protein [Microvirga sp. STS03]MBW3363827.1 hypothetical protein [Pontibacter populi]
MKTLLTSVLLALLILTGCSKSDDPAPLPKIKSVSSYMYNYDIEGNLIENRRLAWSQEVYDVEGVLLKKQYRKAHYLTDHENPLFTENNTYENGLLIKKEILRSDYPTHNTYNKYLYVNGTLNGYDYYSISGGTHYLLKKYRYEYITGNNPSKMLINDYPFDEAPAIYEYAYDSHGNKIREHISGNSAIKGTYEWEFDAYNNQTKEIFTRSWGTYSTSTISTYKYDATNKIAEKLTHYSTDFGNYIYDYGSYKYIYEYDKNGLLKTVNIFYLNKDVTNGEFRLDAELRYEYEFNK